MRRGAVSGSTAMKNQYFRSTIRLNVVAVSIVTIAVIIVPVATRHARYSRVSKAQMELKPQKVQIIQLW